MAGGWGRRREIKRGQGEAAAGGSKKKTEIKGFLGLIKNMFFWSLALYLYNFYHRGNIFLNFLFFGIFFVLLETKKTRK